jgi:hypothetical protein
MSNAEDMTGVGAIPPGTAVSVENTVIRRPEFASAFTPQVPIKRRKTTHWKAVAKTAQAAVVARQQEIDALYASLEEAIIHRTLATRAAWALGVGWLLLLFAWVVL